jgi:hypothetical protein
MRIEPGQHYRRNLDNCDPGCRTCCGDAPLPVWLNVESVSGQWVRYVGADGLGILRTTDIRRHYDLRQIEAPAAYDVWIVTIGDQLTAHSVKALAVAHIVRSRAARFVLTRCQIDTI